MIRVWRNRSTLHRGESPHARCTDCLGLYRNGCSPCRGCCQIRIHRIQNQLSEGDQRCTPLVGDPIANSKPYSPVQADRTLTLGPPSINSGPPGLRSTPPATVYLFIVKGESPSPESPISSPPYLANR